MRSKTTHLIGCDQKNLEISNSNCTDATLMKSELLSVANVVYSHADQHPRRFNLEIARI